MAGFDLREGEIDRRSRRTGQGHSMGGFVGGADYEGERAEFIPYLRAAKWTGGGRQTVWAKGVVSDEVVGRAIMRGQNSSRA